MAELVSDSLTNSWVLLRSRIRAWIRVKSALMNIVGPGITLEDYESGRAKPIDLFEGQIKKWILDIAQSLAREHERQDDAGIAVLLLSSAVLEPLGGVLPLEKGRKSSEAKFCNGFVRVFGSIPGAKNVWQVAERVCELLRHGLFHEAFIKAGIVLTHQGVPIREENGILYLDASRFVERIGVAFDEVCTEIRQAEPADPVRRAFDAYWNQRETEQPKKLESIVVAGAEYPPVLSTSTLAPINPKKWLKEM